MSDLKKIAQLGAWLLPSGPTKNTLLRALGHDVHPTARVRPNIVWNVRTVSLGARSRIGILNLIKDVRKLAVDDDAAVGRMNVISSHPAFARLYENGAELRIGTNGKITSQHHVDCSGGVAIGAFASIAGRQTRIMTHSVDIGADAQAAYPVLIGERSLVGTRSLILGGAVLAERSVLAAGSVLPKSRGEQPSGLWAGVPAKFKGPLKGKWFDRHETSTTRVLMPETGEIIEDAL